MSSAARLLALLKPLPGDAAVPVRWLRELLERETAGGEEPRVGDLTLEDVAEEVGRAASTVRGWCSSGKLKGAYKLNDRDWRVPRAALERFLDAQRAPGPATVRSRAPVDLGAWRRHVSEGGGA